MCEKITIELTKEEVAILLSTLREIPIEAMDRREFLKILAKLMVASLPPSINPPTIPPTTLPEL